ncbi:hypothetical protein V6N13_084182 [Hibiscus sabdariffa]|uniref:P-type ATPase C-terminal domain-containing protein n=1 Tax=Hibiscus sabdariffa TaxID=183260 RepID=A0ABR2T0A2_9ROSI
MLGQLIPYQFDLQEFFSNMSLLRSAYSFLHYISKSHFTWIQHLFIWGSIAMWYLFLFVYDKLSPTMSGNAYRLLVEALAPAPIYWTDTLLVTITCNFLYLANISYQMCFHPLDHHIIQEIKYYKKDVEDQRMWTRERPKAREKTMIGFTVNHLIQSAGRLDLTFVVENSRLHRLISGPVISSSSILIVNC